MQVQIETFLAKNSDGEPVLKIEMINDESDSWLKFKCVFIIEYDKNSEMTKSVIELTSPEITPEREINIIQGILTHVTMIESINKCKATEVSKEEKRKEEELNKVLLHIVRQGIAPYEPLSKIKNSFSFKKVVNKLLPCISNLTKIDRKLFETLIYGSTELQNDYIDYYSSNSSFYTIAVTQAHSCYNFYFMNTNGIVLFFFTKKPNFQTLDANL